MNLKRNSLHRSLKMYISGTVKTILLFTVSITIIGFIFGATENSGKEIPSEINFECNVGDVSFPHKSHFDMMGIECVKCHHEAKSGGNTQSCSNCHHYPKNYADETMSPKVAIHKSCWSCHKVGTGVEASKSCKKCHKSRKEK